MASRARASLPAVLAVPLLADRLTVELDGLADEVRTLDESPAGRERAAFITSAARQVEQYGTAGSAHVETPAPEFRPSVVGDDVETRTG